MTSFKLGDRVQLNPANSKHMTASQWNLLGKIGKITSIQHTTAAVLFDKLKTTRVFHIDDLMRAEVKK